MLDNFHGIAGTPGTAHAGMECPSLLHWGYLTTPNTLKQGNEFLVTLVNNAVSLKSLLTLSILQLWGSKTDYFDKYSSVAQLTTPTTTCIHRSSLTGLCAFIHRSSLTGLCAFIPFTAACHHTLLVSYVHVTVIPAITVAGIRDERRWKPKHT